MGAIPAPVRLRARRDGDFEVEEVVVSLGGEAYPSIFALEPGKRQAEAPKPCLHAGQR